jgi:hypothetical protein
MRKGGYTGVSVPFVIVGAFLRAEEFLVDDFFKLDHFGLFTGYNMEKMVRYKEGS